MTPEELALDGRVHESTWAPVDLIAADAAPPEPPTIAGLFYPGRTHLVSGEPESLKSWLALVACVDEIRAGRVVAYVDFEMSPRDVCARLRDLGLEDEEIRRGFVYLHPDERLDDGNRAVLDALLARWRPSLVVVDALAGAFELHGLDENATRDVETFWRSVVGRLRAYGAAVALLDHVAKNGETRGRWAIGSQRKVGAADVHLGLDPVEPFGRGRIGCVRIFTRKDCPGFLPRPRAAELALTSDPETGAITWRLDIASPEQDAPTPFRPTHLMERVSRYVEANEKPPSRNAVEKNVHGNGKAIRTAIDVLLADGFLVAERGSRGAQLLRCERPYRESDEVSSSSSSDVISTSSETKSPDLVQFVPPSRGDEAGGDEVEPRTQP